MTLAVNADQSSAPAPTKKKEVEAVQKEIEEVVLQITQLSIIEAKEARQLEFNKEVIETRDKINSVLQGVASAVRDFLIGNDKLESKPATLRKEVLYTVEASVQDKKIKILCQLEELQVKKKEILASFFCNEPRVVFPQTATKVTNLPQLLLLSELLPENLKQVLAQNIAEDVKIAEFVKQVNPLAALAATSTQALDAEKASHETTRSALSTSRQRVKLMNPLFDVGVTICKGDFELGKRIRHNGTCVYLRGGPQDRTLINARNNVAHGGNVLADYPMIELARLNHNQKEMLTLRYKEKMERSGFLKVHMLSKISCDNWGSFLDMRGTMFSCYIGTKYVTHNKEREAKFKKLDKEIEDVLEKYIRESIEPIPLHDALKKLDEDRVSTGKIRKMKAIADEFAKEE